MATFKTDYNFGRKLGNKLFPCSRNFITLYGQRSAAITRSIISSFHHKLNIYLFNVSKMIFDIFFLVYKTALPVTTQWQLKLSNRVHFISRERWRRGAAAAAACSTAAHRSAVLQSACIRGDWRFWLFSAVSFLIAGHVITKWVFSFTPKEQDEKYYLEFSTH